MTIAQPVSRRRGSSSSRPSPVFWGIVGLSTLAFIQGFFLFPLVDHSGGPAAGEMTPDVNLPERTVRILVSSGEPTLVLKPVFDLPDAARDSDEALDARFFPEGPAHRYWVLIALHRGAEPVRLDLASPPPVLVDRDGREYRTTPLGPAAAARAGELPRYLSLWVRLSVPPDGVLEIPPRSRRRALLVFPEDADPEKIESARIGETLLDAREFPKDRLDSEIESPSELLRAKKP